MARDIVQSPYLEGHSAGNAFRREYARSVSTLVERKKADAQRERDQYASKIARDREGCREDLKAILGWPLTVAERGAPFARKTEIFSDAAMRIFRVQLEVFADFWFYGLLFEHTDKGKLPLVISQHGGLGTPELCSSFFSCNRKFLVIPYYKKECVLAHSRAERGRLRHER